MNGGDPYLRVVVEGWRTMAKALDSVTDMVIQGIYANVEEFNARTLAFPTGHSG
jgi:hypothetical protein